MTRVALRTKMAQGLFCLHLGCWSSSYFFPTSAWHFLLLPPGEQLRLLPAKQSQYPRVLLWKEWQHPLRVYEEKKKERKGKKEKKQDKQDFFFKCYKTGRKTVPPLNISTYQISRCQGLYSVRLSVPQKTTGRAFSWLQIPQRPGRLLEISRLVAGRSSVLAKWRIWQSFPGVPLKKLDSVLFVIKTFLQFLQFLLPPAISCVRSPKVGLPQVLSKSQTPALPWTSSGPGACFSEFVMSI